MGLAGQKGTATFTTRIMWRPFMAFFAMLISAPAGSRTADTALWTVPKWRGSVAPLTMFMGLTDRCVATVGAVRTNRAFRWWITAGGTMPPRRIARALQGGAAIDTTSRAWRCFNMAPGTMLMAVAGRQVTAGGRTQPVGWGVRTITMSRTLAASAGRIAGLTQRMYRGVRTSVFRGRRTSTCRTSSRRTSRSCFQQMF